MFEYGLRHGIGQLREKNGDIYTGTWIQDKLEGLVWHQNPQTLGERVT